MTDHPIALGIDGGASTLKWSIRDSAGQIRHGESPGANLQLLGWDRYTAALAGAADAALAAIGAGRTELRAVGMGLSGVDRPQEKEQLERWAPTLYPGLRGCWIGNDAWPALRQGAGRLAGLILIAGTGSICLGVAADGRSVRAGGWGALIGDEGSGWGIGREALVMASWMADGRRRPTALLPRVVETLGLDDALAIIPWVGGSDLPELKQRIARLTPLVMQLAAEDDPAARQIVRRALAHLGRLVRAVAGRLDQMGDLATERPLVCAGSLLVQSESFFNGLTKLLAAGANAATPPFRPVRLLEPASLGALALGEEHDVPHNS